MMFPSPLSLRVRVALATFWAASLVAISTASAGSDANSAVVPFDAHFRGQSHAEWLARHWQWVFSLPVDQHPLFDNADCSTGQSGNVWFLSGTLQPVIITPGVILGEVDRDCVIPSGTALFLAIFTGVNVQIQGNGATEAEIRAIANLLGDYIVPESIFLEIDGVPVTGLESYRVDSPLFASEPLPENNYVGVAAGTIVEGVADGYSAIIKPLSVGTHTLHFGGVADLTSIGGPIFIQDVSYTITVVPRGQY